jgi:hypothetical protein
LEVTLGHLLPIKKRAGGLCRRPVAAGVQDQQDLLHLQSPRTSFRTFLIFMDSSFTA